MGEVSKYWWIERKRVIILGEKNELVVEEIEWGGWGGGGREGREEFG